MKLVEHEIDTLKIKAVGDSVIVLVDSLPELSHLLITPDFGGRKPVTGLVFSIGSRVEYAEIGDRLFFTRFTGREFWYNDNKYQVLIEGEIFAKVDLEVDCVEIAQ